MCVRVCVYIKTEDRGAEGGGHAQALVLNDARLLLLVYIGASCDWRRTGRETGKGTQLRRAVGGGRACL